MTRYLYNHLNVVRVNTRNSREFPQYPAPWVLIASDDNQIVGDGPTEAAAKEDAQQRREVGVPSPKAQARLRKDRKERRLRRQQQHERLRGQ